jgi:hypothetical protein
VSLPRQKAGLPTPARTSPAIRYPGDWPVLSASDVSSLGIAAERILNWAEQAVRR